MAINLRDKYVSTCASLSVFYILVESQFKFRLLSTNNCIIIKISDEVSNPIRSSRRYTEDSTNLPSLNNSGYVHYHHYIFKSIPMKIKMVILGNLGTSYICPNFYTDSA
ncbi:hypothetical protein V8E54_007662 [Elaphomyces granulatus]